MGAHLASAHRTRRAVVLLASMAVVAACALFLALFLRAAIRHVDPIPAQGVALSPWDCRGGEWLCSNTALGSEPEVAAPVGPLPECRCQQGDPLCAETPWKTCVPATSRELAPRPGSGSTARSAWTKRSSLRPSTVPRRKAFAWRSSRPTTRTRTPSRSIARLEAAPRRSPSATSPIRRTSRCVVSVRERQRFRFWSRSARELGAREYDGVAVNVRDAPPARHGQHSTTARVAGLSR